MREGAPQPPGVYGGGAPDLLAERKGTPPEGGGIQSCQPAQAPGRLEALARPSAPRRAGGEVRPRPAGRRGPAGLGRPGRTRPQSSWVGPSQSAVGAPGAAARLVGTSHPGARARPGTWQIPGLPVPGSGPRDKAGPTPSCALIWASGGVILRGPPRPQSCRWTPACCPGDQTRSPVSPPPLGQWNGPRTCSSSFVSGRRGLNQCWGGGTVMEVRAAGRVPSPSASARVARPGSSSSSKNPTGPRAGRTVP